jgi:hypothetical protein
LIAYASRTGTKRNLAGLRAAGWRLMVSAKGVLRNEGFPYSLDNGAWWSFVNKADFDEAAFLRAHELLGEHADFVVLPDIVAGGLASLEFSLRWRERLGPGKWMLAVQDGMSADDVGGLVGPGMGVFVGGTTEWKEATMALRGQVARSAGASMHVGRVNSARRIALCVAAGADSFDGSGASRFAVELSNLDSAMRQGDIFAP